MGFFSGLFKQKQIQPITTDLRNPERRATDAYLSGLVSQYGSQYKPGQAYGGQYTAGPSGFEQRGLDEFLSQYLNQEQVTPNLRSAQDYLSQTLKGGFDPRTSPAYQSFRDEAAYNNQRALDQARADLGSRGKYFSSEGLRTEGDIGAQTSIGLNRNLAQLYENERQRQERGFQAAPGFEKYMQGIPLERAGAALGYGALPREISQKDLEMRYEDFKRQQGELGDITRLAASGVSSQPLSQSYPAYQKSPFEKYVSPILQTALPLIGTAFGGPIGGMLGGAAGSFLGGMGGGGGFNPSTMSTPPQGYNLGFNPFGMVARA